MLSGSPGVKPNIAPWSRVTRLTPAIIALAAMGGSGGEFHWFLLTGGQHLYVGPTDINHQHIHDRGSKTHR